MCGNVIAQMLAGGYQTVTEPTPRTLEPCSSRVTLAAAMRKRRTATGDDLKDLQMAVYDAQLAMAILSEFLGEAGTAAAGPAYWRSFLTECGFSENVADQFLFAQPTA